MQRAPKSAVACAVALAALAVASGLAAPARAAAPEGPSWQITPYAGYTFFVDPFYSRLPGEVRAKDAVHFGADVGRQFGPPFGIQIGAGYTPTELKEDGRKADFIHAHGDLMYAPLRGPDWDLYGLAGGGYEQYITDGAGHRDAGSFDFGAGLHLWFTSHLALRAEARNVLLMAREQRLQASKDNDVIVIGGLTWALGGKLKDSDGDGVPDKHDTCPGTPAGAKVDAKGCPTDADGDGVADGIDQCPDTPKGAKVDAKGCPTDLDGDGVFDGIDLCPDTPKGAVVDATGCPKDQDGDGVFDGLDQCADTPHGATVDANGCPKDSDGDGVYDGLDKCPDTPAEAKVDKDGCPIEVLEKETELLDTGMIRLSDVNFATGKADILPESYPALDQVGQVLSKWPELEIEIGGHTDSRGSAELNQKLSEARATSVQKYLLDKFPGLKPEQFSVKGYGMTKPLQPNTSALNMAKNRRVEFVVLNKDALKREVERRKTLEK